MPRSPIVWFAIASVLGALAVAPLSWPDRCCVLGALAVLAVVLETGSSEMRHVRALAAVALVSGAAYAFVRAQAEPIVRETRTMRFAGTVLDERSDDGALRTYAFAIERGPQVLITVHDALAAGERAIVRGRLEPLDDARNPGEPSERSIEREHHIVGRIASAAVLRVDRAPPHGAAARLAQLRAWALASLRAHLGDPDAAIVAGELWGERGAMPPELRTEFQTTGTVHVLVTAGLHVGLVAALVLALGVRLTLPRVAACALAMLVAWFFAIVSGGALPALRAAAMATAMLSARACGRAVISWNALALAAVTIVAIDPQSVASASFWLSFCCVAAIFALAAPIESLLRMHVPHPRVREACAMTLATQCGTWPVTAAVFLRFAPYALAANVAVVPLVPLTMLLGAAQLALAWVPPLAQAAANLNGWVLAWTIGVVELLAHAPGASLPMTPAPSWCIAAYEAALLAFVPLIRRGGATLAGSAVVMATALVLWPPGSMRGVLHITMLDVGQADSIVIETPAHHAILVDAGGRLERGPQGSGSVAERVGERIVVPFLLSEGIHALDAMIISHPHGDHVGGCAPVLRTIRVAEIADSGQTYGGHAYHDCLDTARADHVPIVYPRAGDVWRTNDGVTLTFIGPSLPFIGGKNAINDNSIAFILQYRSFRMLFTGDAGVAAEQRFLGEGIDLASNVLKVGHHGSAYSSSPAFIAAIHPRYALISVGRHNLFGHPAPSTLARLSSFGARSYRTDLDGAFSIETDGLSLSDSVMLSKR